MSGMALEKASGLDRARAEEFLYWEAELLDGGRYDEWLELFTADGAYWIPSNPVQTDPYLAPSHAFEDDLLRRVRVERFRGQYSYSLQPAPRSSRMLSNVRVRADVADLSRWSVLSTFLVTQFHGDETHRFAGGYIHELVADGEQLRIASKKIMLLDADGPLPDILIIL
ncbi:aromatic-ring-hydroxylating dioxygenase subunit beta [Rhizorhabdus wittichii]|uniref:Aromatic-ring-hydroxylating dioxygenase subunit beta n=1 Tax=Rhizorhabdus wittichii TaxID=160791 RepID=A0A975D709_9SPHN|nr:aromatic-ring-hydroxylating dioxygenase subunit beta [Rhizorhabdus wittichii]QTH23988.1 aromatic-ring-hydroxylating dioxygenase subunit beta [Rhizorhabdus wittichii]